MRKVGALVTQRSRYALRAVFELTKREGQGLVKTADIAKAISKVFDGAAFADLVERDRQRRSDYVATCSI